MRTSPAKGYSLPIALLLAMVVCRIVPAAGRSNAAPNTQDPALDATRDPRLSRRVLLRSEGATLEQVLAQLTRLSGVALRVQGPERDERLVAFVPEAPLQDVLSAIAELYRLRWARVSGSPPTYTAALPGTLRQEEARQRRRAYEAALQRLEAGADTSRTARPLLQALVPLVRARMESLLGDGFLELRLRGLPEAARDELQRQGGKGEPGTVLVEARRGRIWIGLTGESGAARPLYEPFREAAPPPSLNRPSEPPLFKRIVRLPPERGERRGDWIAALGRFSDSAGVAVYADHYPAPAAARSQAVLRLPDGVPAARWLDAFAQPPAGPAAEGGSASDWSPRGRSVLLRSRTRRWDAEEVPPHRLLQRLEQSAGAGGRLEAADLSLLATLTPAQARAVMEGPGSLAAWNRAVRITARLGEAARAKTIVEGVEWSDLTPPEQALVERLLPLRPGAAAEFTARVEARRSLTASQGRVVALRFQSKRGEARGGSALFPLGTTDPVTGLPRETVLALPANRTAPRVPEVSRLVLAHYDPDPPAGNRDYAHRPARNAVGETEAERLARHLGQLRRAGVDAVVCAWEPGGAGETAVLRLMQAAGPAGVRVCLLLEDRRPDRTLSAETLAGALAPLSASPAYLKVQGRPVLFLSRAVRNRMGPQSWADLLAGMERKVPPGIVTLAPAGTPTQAVVFDGLYPETVFLTGAGHFRNEIVAGMTTLQHGSSDLARRHRRIAVGTVSPGWQEGKEPSWRMDRAEGRLYRDSWEVAMLGQPDWILVDSFNRWASGTEIEPSVEHGDLYLRVTAELSQRFKKEMPRSK